MRSPKTVLVRFLEEDSGATAVEYGIIAFAIFIAILTLVQSVGDQLAILYGQVEEGIVAVQQ